MLNHAFKARVDASPLPAPGNIRLAAVPQGRAPHLFAAVPDAAIFEAWEEFKAAQAAYTAMPDDVLSATPGLEEKITDDLFALEERLMAIPTASLDGLAIKLTMSLLNGDITAEQHQAVLDGALPSADSLEDMFTQGVLTVLLDIERMIKQPASVAHGRPPFTDPVVRQAWVEFVAAQNALPAVPRDSKEDEARRFGLFEAAEAAFFEAPVTSLEAIALRLRWQLQDGLQSKSLSDVVCSGAPLSGDQFEAEGEHEKLLALDLLQAVEAMIAQPATDTAIQLAWANYLAAQASYNSSDGLSFEALIGIEGEFLDIPVTDYAGAALRLRWLLELNATPDAHAVILSGVPLTPDLFTDCGERETVKLILDIERLAAGVPS